MLKIPFNIIELENFPACPICSNKTAFIYTLDNTDPSSCKLSVECGACSHNPVGEPTSLEDGSIMGRHNQIDALELWSYAITNKSIRENTL